MNTDNPNQSHKQSVGNESFILGADVIALLIPVKHPMIMVDSVVEYSSAPLSLVAGRYVSANEPAFVGHFPGLKLWPGVYTLEGLRQACLLLNIVSDLEKAGLLKGLTELHKRQTLQPQVNHKLCQGVIDYLQEKKPYDPEMYSTSLKFLEPVFAGSLIRYHVIRDENNNKKFAVTAMVNERVIARGRIVSGIG